MSGHGIQSGAEGVTAYSAADDGIVVYSVDGYEGITAEQVRQEIQKAIDRAFYNPSNALTSYRIRQIPCKGERPTPEELIVYVAEQASK